MSARGDQGRRRPGAVAGEAAAAAAAASRRVASRSRPRGCSRGSVLSPGRRANCCAGRSSALIVVTLTATVVAFRLPQLAGLAIGEAVGKLGFTLRHVETRGNHRVSDPGDLRHRLQPAILRHAARRPRRHAGAAAPPALDPGGAGFPAAARHARDRRDRARAGRRLAAAGAVPSGRRRGRGARAGRARRCPIWCG